MNKIKYPLDKSLIRPFFTDMLLDMFFTNFICRKCRQQVELICPLHIHYLKYV